MFEKHDTAVILAAHGSSKDVRVNQPMFALAKTIRAVGQFGMVTPAFLDGNPSIQQILGDIPQRHVVVVPWMASHGYYTNVVFPKLLDSKQKQVRFAPAIGDEQRLPDLVINDIGMTLAKLPGNRSVSIIVVGHGTRRNKKSCLTTIRLVQNLRNKLQRDDIQFAFIDQRPYIDHVFAKTATEHIVIVPFLMSLGPHATSDIPQAFGAGDMTTRMLNDNADFPLQWQIPASKQIVFYTRPVGTYMAWADICIELANHACATEVAA